MFLNIDEFLTVPPQMPRLSTRVRTSSTASNKRPLLVRQQHRNQVGKHWVYLYGYYCMLLCLASRSSTFTRALTTTRAPFPRTSSFVTSTYSTTRRIASPLHITMSLQQEQQQQQEETLVVTHEKAKLIPSTHSSLSKAGKRLAEGDLVSFPTETVYGLGCHALNPHAIAKVFAAKERPLTDPLIVHVTDTTAALNLWQAFASADDNLEAQLLTLLTGHFWPGPLTIVAQANPSVPSTLMANTGYVACRSPRHVIARALIAASGVPIAAPSANKFGHVSPTKASHVWDDLKGEDVWIVDPDLDGEDGDQPTQDQGGSVCNVGVESTVAKIEMSSSASGTITILRHGAVSAKDLSNCLTSNVELQEAFTVQEKMQSTKEDVSHVAPGQTIRHYSPNVLSYMISQCRYDGKQASSSLDSTLTHEERTQLSKAVIIDWGGRLHALQPHALAYRDVSPNDSSTEAAASVFETLRWSETVDGAERVYFPEICVEKEDEEEEQEALVLAVKDRLTRAASGVVVDTFI